MNCPESRINKRIKYKEIKAVLDRECSIAGSKELIDKYSLYLFELVNFSTRVFARVCNKPRRNIGGSPVSLIALYYHVIQMTDAIQVLTSQACFDATLPLLRSQLESTVAIEFMLAKDYELRSAAWLVGHYLDQKRFLESQDYATERGRDFKSKILKDRFAGFAHIREFDLRLINRGMADIDRILQKPKFAPIAEAFKKGNVKYWYQYNGGPKNIEQIFGQLQRPLEYELLYRRYSEISHARDISRVFGSGGQRNAIAPIRQEVSDDSHYLSASSMLINATKCIISKFRPEENIQMEIEDIVRRHRPEILRKP